MSYTTEQKIEILKTWRERYPDSRVKDEECPRCGVHASSHGVSSYGLDCPWGVSPAAKEGRLGEPRIPRLTS